MSLKLCTSLAALFLCLSAAYGQTAPYDANALAVDVTSLRTTPGSATGELSFVVDSAPGRQETIVVDYADPALGFALVRPDGVEVTSATAEALGFTFANMDQPTGLGAIHSGTSAYHLWIQFPIASQPGNYRIRVNAAVATTQTVVVGTYYSSSAVRVAALTTSPRLRLGQSTVLLAGVFADQVPLPGATVKAKIYPDVPAPQIALSNFTLFSQTTLPDSSVRYVFRAMATNSGPAANVVRAAVASTGTQGFLLESAGFVVGDLPANGSTLTEPTLVIIGPASPVPNPSSFVWSIIQALPAIDVDLLDSGSADVAPGDGTYSANFTPTVAGVYTIRVKITGSSTGQPFSRTATTTINVSNHAQLGVVTDQLIDDNGNGKADRLAVTALVSVQVAGEYTLKGQLRVADGRVVEALSKATLAAGNQTLTMSFPAQDLLALGIDGSYSKRDILLLYNEPDQSQQIVDTRDDAGPTVTIVQGNLDRGPAYFMAPYTATGITTGAPGFFDLLRVEVGAVSTGGECEWTGILTTVSGTEIDVAYGSGT